MSSSEDEKYDPKKQYKNEIIEKQKPVYKYISIEKAMQQIGATSHEMKENEHNKIFALFYNDDNELIEERLTKVVQNLKGKKSYLCYDKPFDNKYKVTNDFTKNFCNDIKLVLKKYQAKNYIIADNSTLTKSNTEKYRVEYLNDDGDVLKISFAIKCKNNSYQDPYQYWFKI